MRNDVKLGLAVGGLLLGVVLAYALFFSNNQNSDRDKDIAAKFGAVDGSTGDAARSTGGGVEQIQDLNPPIANGNAGNTGTNTGEMQNNSQPLPEPVATGAGTNNLLGRSWTELLSGGVASIGPILPPRETGNSTSGTIVPPVRENSIQVDPPAASGPRRYVIKQGDSFWSIARAEYGNPAYFAHIVRANPSVDPARLKPGTPITLPDRNEVIAAATPRQPSAAEQVLDPNTQYRVQSGDNLSVIAKKLYGRYDKWVQIYELNRELIGPNPAVLKNGVILRLPEPPLRVAGSL